MCDQEDDIEWEYEDESDAAAEDAGDGFSSPYVSNGRGAGGDGSVHQLPQDDEDVDWEDATEPTNELTPSHDSEEADAFNLRADEKIVEDLNAVNWDHINSVLQGEAEKESTEADPSKPKRSVVRMTKQDKAHELALHESHLLLLLASQLRTNALCQSRLFRGMLLSLTSDSSFDIVACVDSAPLNYALELLVRWFNCHFRLIGDSREEDENAVVVDSALKRENALLRIVSARQGHHADLALLFTAVCRAIGLRARIVSVLDPLIVRRHSKAAEAAATDSSARKTSKRMRSRHIAAAPMSRGSPLTRAKQSPWTWCEVLEVKTKKWIMVDAVRKLVNQPHGLEPLRGKSFPLSYVVAVEEDGFLTDVTPQYVGRWSKTMPRRLAHGWITQSLQIMNSQSNLRGGLQPQRELREFEREKLHQAMESEEMPTSFEGFKNHHLYCLERHLGRLECVYPRKAVGLFKGNAVYPRRFVQTTRTWFQWRRLGREVKASEKDRPVNRKGVSALPAQTAASDSDSGRTGEQNGDRGVGLALYGFWQTDEVTPPPVDGMIVPKNKYGNIELWSPAHLPRGAVHLQMENIDKVARLLGVDHAQAVVGFESRNGTTYPQFDGIVVAEAVAETLLDAQAHVQQSVIEQAIIKHRQVVVRRWERLVKRVMLKQRLNEEYGEL